MSTPQPHRSSVLDALEQLGRRSTALCRSVGQGTMLLAECLFWTVFGSREKQPVRLSMVVREMMRIGIHALPIASVLAATVGTMLAIQGIYTLRTFGAESTITIGVSLSVLREFAPLITAILVTGRSGSALAARLGTMTINQEVDALTVMGVNPVRYLVAPPLIAMLVMVPALTFWSDLLALGAAGLYICAELNMSFEAYFQSLIAVAQAQDLIHGVAKSALFALLIVLVAVVNGAGVQKGAEGVGSATTNTVVQSIAAIVVTDMVFVFLSTR